MRLRKRLRYVYFRAVRSHGKPREIAAGVAIGVFVGMTPPIPFLHTPLALFLAAVTGQSKIAAALGVWITNPLFAIPLYTAAYAVGAFLLHHPLVPAGGMLHALTEPHTAGAEILVPLLVGGAALGAPMAAAGYWATYQAVVAYRLKRRAGRLQKLHRWHWDAESGWRRVEAPGGPEGEVD